VELVDTRTIAVSDGSKFEFQLTRQSAWQGVPPLSHQNSETASQQLDVPVQSRLCSSDRSEPEAGNYIRGKRVGRRMMYVAFPLLIATMLAYMFFHAGFSMRRQRILSQRAERSRRWMPARLRSRQLN
jgi:hypothetical protein